MMKSRIKLKILLWNIEWAVSRRVREFVLRTLRDEVADVLCLTESTDFFQDEHINTISSSSDYGYSNAGGRRKVWLVSRKEWIEVDTAENSGLPRGRFVSGITFGIRFVGVCIPWSNAHVSTGQKNRKRWEDHVAYLDALRPILGDYATSDTPVCVLGDFNQSVPATSWNADYIHFLYQAFSDYYTIHTRNEIDVDGEQLIDHVATTRSLRFVLRRSIGRNADNGCRVSDHPALIGTLAGQSSDEPELSIDHELE